MTEEQLFPFEEFLNVTTPESSRKSAEGLIANGWRQGRYPAVDMAGPFPWALESQQQRSWNFHLHCLGPVDILLRAHSHWQDVAYLEPALRMTLDWIRVNSDVSSKEVSSFAWYDMAVGMRSYRIAYLLQAAEVAGVLPVQERELLWQSLEQHARYLEQDVNIAFHSNHGYYQIAGQLAMGRRFAHASPLMREAREQGLERFRKMLVQQFSSEGVHLEHSPDYHRMLYATLKALLDSELVADEQIEQRARTIESALSWFVNPDQKLVNFGDSDGRSVTCADADVGQHWVTPEMQFWATAGRLGTLPEEEVVYLVESGYWIVRKPLQGVTDFSAYSYLALNAAFHSRTHKHADDLSIVWFERGCNLLVDAGRYGYIGKTKKDSSLWRDGFWYSDPWRVYCESTRAHNTLEFDGRSYPRRDATPYGSALQRHGQVAGGVYYVEAGCLQFSSIRQERFLFFKPGQWLIVLDLFNDGAGKPHEVKQWFHLGSELEVSLDGDRVVARLPDEKGMLYCTSLLAGPQLSPLYMGEEEPLKQGWISRKEREVQPAAAFCLRQEGSSSGAFATLLSLNGGVEAQPQNSVQLAAGKAEFIWQDETGMHQLRLARQSTRSWWRFSRTTEFRVDYICSEKSAGPV